jgi:hypothetical protein
MKLLGVVKKLILERRQLLDKYEVNGVQVDIFFNDHSNIAINTSEYGRSPVSEILYSMVEVLDVIVDVSLEILNNPKSTTNKKDKDKSILVIDNLIGVDYHFWISKSNNGKLFLTINTSISHPRHLPKDKNDKKIIITKSGETIIREEFDLDNFTKITKGNIIIYYG